MQLCSCGFSNLWTQRWGKQATCTKRSGLIKMKLALLKRWFLSSNRGRKQAQPEAPWVISRRLVRQSARQAFFPMFKHSPTASWPLWRQTLLCNIMYQWALYHSRKCSLPTKHAFNFYIHFKQSILYKHNDCMSSILTVKYFYKNIKVKMKLTSTDR